MEEEEVKGENAGFYMIPFNADGLFSDEAGAKCRAEGSVLTASGEPEVKPNRHNALKTVVRTRLAGNPDRLPPDVGRASLPGRSLRAKSDDCPCYVEEFFEARMHFGPSMSHRGFEREVECARQPTPFRPPLQREV